MLMMFVVLGVFALMTFMTSRKDKKKRAELMSGIKKHDRVQMLGGVIGNVAEITDDEVVIKVEEGRIRFARSAIQAVLTPAKSKNESGAIAEVKGEPKTSSV
jgi:preprotein translocase subunit YajC